MRYLGLIFNKDDDSCIAKVNVVDTLTGLNIITDKLVDLFQKDRDASATIPQYEEYIMWITLPYDDRTYTWEVTPNGTYNAGAVGPNYDMNFNGFVIQEEEPPASTTKTLYLIDNVNSLNYSKVISDGTNSLLITSIFYGDDITTAFKIGSGSLVCHNFGRFSTDLGITWKYPYDMSISYGSNAGYDDEIINSDGEFWINFLTAPKTGVTIWVDVLPVFDSTRVELTLNQPGDISYTNYVLPVSVTDYVAEFKK